MKSWHQSKTVWANVLAFLVAAGIIFGVQADPETVKRDLEILALLMPVINGVLRLVTKQPIQ